MRNILEKREEKLSPKILENSLEIQSQQSLTNMPNTDGESKLSQMLNGSLSKQNGIYLIVDFIILKVVRAVTRASQINISIAAMQSQKSFQYTEKGYNLLI
jgi:hypothetical protein